MNGNDLIKVGIADLQVIRNDGVLVTYALGSCIGICLYDPVTKVAGMLHIMLPNSQGVTTGNLLKYADTGLPIMLQKMQVLGAQQSRITAKIAGGAKMFDIPGDTVMGSIGSKNIIAVRALLQQYRIRLLGEDLGSDYARTMFFDASNGQVRIQSYGKPNNIF